VNEIDGLAALEPRELCMVAYRSVDSRVDIDAVAEGLDRRGWFVGRLAEPRGIHFAINPVHDPIVDEYLADLRAVVAEVRDQGLVGKAAGRTY
jgi:glutamate/tyrosine decarboxylase-like PLP-dependent enzyme